MANNRKLFIKLSEIKNSIKSTQLNESEMKVVDDMLIQVIVYISDVGYYNNRKIKNKEVN